MIAVVKYKAGNIQSVLYALERLGADAQVTDDPATLMKADKVIFPGVGEARSAMESLRENRLDEAIKQLKQPLLGICVGMQLLCAHSEENDTICLGIVPVKVKLFQLQDRKLKVPQIGWNTITDLEGPLFRGINDHSFVYNVHSYYAEDSDYTIARCEYGISYAAAIRKDNFYGVQFHAEKSAETGDHIIKNFLEL